MIVVGPFKTKIDLYFLVNSLANSTGLFNISSTSILDNLDAYLTWGVNITSAFVLFKISKFIFDKAFKPSASIINVLS